MGKLLYEEESFSIRHAIFEVYKEMGNGLTEPVYQECTECELALEDIPFEAQKELALAYKGKPLEKKYIPDLICYGKIIVELKAVKELCPEHRAQVLNYLKITGLRLNLLVNFGHYPDVEIERVVL
jgi:GxxExxY protein